MSHKTYRNILIIKMSSLGDVIHALPSLYVLRKRYPEAHITWAVHEPFAPILPGKPWIDEIYIVDRKKIKDFSYWKKVWRDLHSRHFDLVIDLQMIAKSGLIALLSGGAKKIGYQDAREGSGLCSCPIVGGHKNDHIIEQLLDVMRYIDCPVTDICFPFGDYTIEKRKMEQLLRVQGIEMPFIILVPGTRGENKKWPLSSWGELAKRFAEKGFFCLVCGAPNEWEMANEILAIAKSNYIQNWMGRTNLMDLVALESMATLHISVDTGPLHIANAVGTSLIGLFGPTLPQRSGPYGNSESHVLMAEHAGTKESDMKTISVGRVFDLGMEIIKKNEYGNDYKPEQ